MNVKSLRLDKNWSQEQLAQLSGLNIRTIQRIEKGDSVGLETLKSLAAVFEVDVNELKNHNSKQHKLLNTQEESVPPFALENKKALALEKVRSIKYFYILTFFLVAIWLFLMLPNYNQGENLGPLIVTAISFAIIIGGYAILVFQPFGEKWEQKKIKQFMDEKDKNSKDID
jgi:transcriptional regulator with XRE-family HTH domain